MQRKYHESTTSKKERKTKTKENTHKNTMEDVLKVIWKCNVKSKSDGICQNEQRKFWERKCWSSFFFVTDLFFWVEEKKLWCALSQEKKFSNEIRIINQDEHLSNEIYTFQTKYALTIRTQLENRTFIKTQKKMLTRPNTLQRKQKDV